MVILMNKKGIRQFSPEMRLRSRDRWRIKGDSPSGTSRGPTFSPKFHLNVLNLGRNDMRIVRNHEAVQHQNPRFCTPEVEPVSHSNSRATSGGTHRSGSGSSAHETAQDPRDGDDAARRRATRGSVGERIGNGEALPSRFEQDVVRDGEAGNFRLDDEAGQRRESRGGPSID